MKENIGTYIWRKLGVLSFLTGAQLFRKNLFLTLRTSLLRNTNIKYPLKQTKSFMNGAIEGSAVCPPSQLWLCGRHQHPGRVAGEDVGPGGGQGAGGGGPLGYRDQHRGPRRQRLRGGGYARAG